MADYDDIAKYFDITTEKMTDYKSEAKNIQSILKEYQATSVYDIACGTGSHLIELNKLGFQCTGSDISKNMIEEAKKKAESDKLDISFHTCDLRKIKTKDKYDAVLALYALGFLSSKEELKKLFKKVHKILAPGGVFLFNVLNAGFEHCGLNEDVIGKSVCSMDILLNTKDLSIVRFSNNLFQEGVQHWSHTYFIQEKENFQVKVMQQNYQTYTNEEIQELLVEAGFIVKNIAYEDVAAFHKWDMLVVAEARERV